MNLRAHDPPPESGEHLAALCKAAGDPLRLSILRVLCNDSFGVLELAQIFDIGQSGMSHHLKVLAQARLVATRREGNAIFYRRALPGAGAEGGVHAALLDSIDQLPLIDEIRTRIDAVHRRRAEVSREFFARSAAKFQAQQDLIAGLPHYRDSVAALLDSLALAEDATALEVGPGDGAFLPELAQRFRSVLAIDNSPEMLDLARQVCARERLSNVQLLLADALDGETPWVDCIVLNMVLHHFATPAEAIRHLASRLRPGGTLLITELCSHDQSWARSACGDLWLGFDQDDLARWAKAAGLYTGESLYLGLRNGFQIQVRQFQRPALAPPSLSLV